VSHVLFVETHNSHQVEVLATHHHGPAYRPIFSAQALAFPASFGTTQVVLKLPKKKEAIGQPSNLLNQSRNLPDLLQLSVSRA
jgi:hypothetical protein